MKERLQFRAAKVEPPVQSVPPLFGVEPISVVPPEAEEGPSENPCEENVVDKKEKVLDTIICLFFCTYCASILYACTSTPPSYKCEV